MLQENSSELIERAHRAGTTEEDGPTDSWLQELRDKKAEERAFTLTGKKKKGKRASRLRTRTTSH